MLLKQKSPPLPRNLALETFGKLLILFSTKVNLLYLLYSAARRCCVLHLIRQNCLPKFFLKTLDHSEISLPVSPSAINLKLHNISVTPKMTKKTNLYSSKASAPDCIPVVVLKNYEPELSYMLPEFFSMCLKESCRVCSLVVSDLHSETKGSQFKSVC